MKLSKILETTTLTESVSYTYKVPSDNEQAIVDLYLWMFYWRNMDDIGSNEKAALGDSTLKDLKDIVNRSTKKIADHMVEKMKEVAFVAVASELVYAISQRCEENEYPERSVLRIAKKLGQESEAKAWIDETNNYKEDIGKDKDRKTSGDEQNERSYKACMKIWGMERFSDFMHFAKAIFGKHEWCFFNYGGEPWANIAEHAIALGGARSLREKLFYLDRFINLSHNTNTVLNKHIDYDDEWWPATLDGKGGLTIRELARISSIPAHIIGRLNRSGKFEKALEEPIDFADDENYKVVNRETGATRNKIQNARASAAKRHPRYKEFLDKSYGSGNKMQRGRFTDADWSRLTHFLDPSGEAYPPEEIVGSAHDALYYALFINEKPWPKGSKWEQMVMKSLIPAIRYAIAFNIPLEDSRHLTNIKEFAKFYNLSSHEVRLSKEYIAKFGMPE